MTTRQSPSFLKRFHPTLTPSSLSLTYRDRHLVTAYLKPKIDLFQVFHVWECTPAEMGMLVKKCFVTDGEGEDHAVVDVQW